MQNCGWAPSDTECDQSTDTSLYQRLLQFQSSVEAALRAYGTPPESSEDILGTFRGAELAVDVDQVTGFS